MRYEFFYREAKRFIKCSLSVFLFRRLPFSIFHVSATDRIFGVSQPSSRTLVVPSIYIVFVFGHCYYYDYDYYHYIIVLLLYMHIMWSVNVQVNKLRRIVSGSNNVINY